MSEGETTPVEDNDDGVDEESSAHDQETSSEVPQGSIEQKLREAKDKPELVLTHEESESLKRGQEYRRGEQDLKNRRRIANWAIGGMVFQILVADVVFAIYALTMGARLPVGALQVWLGTTVVQVVGVVLVITQYLFPSSGRNKA